MSFLKFFFIAALAFSFLPAQGLTTEKSLFETDLLLGAMQTEMKRAEKDLRLPEQPEPYFIEFWIQETATVSISGKYGAITYNHSDMQPLRTASAQIRVGKYEFDNSNLPLNMRYNPDSFEDMMDESAWHMSQVPVDGNGASLRTALWLLSDLAYKRAIGDYQKKKMLQATSIEKDKLNDFSKETPNVSVDAIKQMSFDADKWKDIIRKVTAHLASRPDVMEPKMDINAGRVINYYMNTEGTVLRTSEVYYKVDMAAWSRTSDGIKVRNFRNFFVRDTRELPDMKGFIKEADTLAKELEDLCNAEEFKPYTGPAILAPDVAGVFFHEALGHRLEGERQRQQESGQTFKGKIGEKILPEFLTILDDPTLDKFKGKTLAGSYKYDDEGVAAQKVVLIEKGFLKNYLLSRTPVKGFDKSNGHGRSQGPGAYSFMGRAVGRMGNFIVESNKKLQPEKLKAMLIEEAKKQGKPYGLIIKRVKAGETNTQASQGYGGSFQAFRATPVLVYSVDVETGQEKLVRSVELVGTPLVSLEKIIATGDDADIFNGICGAESGQVPVSVIAPSILTAQVELQRVGGSPKRPPILPSPFKEVK